jgi:hypothetical protein
MDTPTILIKIAGAIFLVFTIRSIYMHVKDKRKAKLEQKKEVQSRSEQVLNSVLLYVWLTFSLAFSIGMMVNN